MNINWKRFYRKTHYWGAILIALPMLIVIISGLLLMLKKDISWIQPTTMRSQHVTPILSMEKVLNVSKTVGAANIQDWDDIDRIDIRPAKGIMKVRAKNHWEIQLDQETGEILQVAYRRSEIIESLHDGTFFHEHAKLWFFLPASIVLFVLWCTGIYMFLQPILAKRKSRQRRANAISATTNSQSA